VTCPIRSSLIRAATWSRIAFIFFLSLTEGPQSKDSRYTRVTLVNVGKAMREFQTITIPLLDLARSHSWEVKVLPDSTRPRLEDSYPDHRKGSGLDMRMWKYFHNPKWRWIPRKASHNVTNAMMWRTSLRVRRWSSRPQ
jgi:hypothetical protein